MKLLIIPFLLFLASCGKDDVSTYCSHCDGNFSPVHSELRWGSSSLPVVIKVPVEHQNQTYSAAFNNASMTWNNALGFNAIEIVFEGTDVYKTKTIPYRQEDWSSDDIFSMVFPDKWVENSSNSVLAVTAIKYYERSKEIIHADIIFNIENYKFSDLGKENGVDFDLESIVTHEIGHFLGLGHVCKTEVERKSFGVCKDSKGDKVPSLSNYNSCIADSKTWSSDCVGEIGDLSSLDSSSIMNRSINSGDIKNSLSSKDIENIQSKYK